MFPARESEIGHRMSSASVASFRIVDAPSLFLPRLSSTRLSHRTRTERKNIFEMALKENLLVPKPRLGPIPKCPRVDHEEVTFASASLFSPNHHVRPSGRQPLWSVHSLAPSPTYPLNLHNIVLLLQPPPPSKTQPSSTPHHALLLPPPSLPPPSPLLLSHPRPKQQQQHLLLPTIPYLLPPRLFSQRNRPMVQPARESHLVLRRPTVGETQRGNSHRRGCGCWESGRVEER